MIRMLSFVIALALGANIGNVLGGGSDYAIAPGKLAKFSGKVSEWPVPTPEFARDPAPGPDGDIYVSIMYGNKIAHFDTDKQTFNEWDLPPGARPHGLLVDKDGIRKMIVDARGRLWYMGSHNGRSGVVE